jgi:hypothetical protein
LFVTLNMLQTYSKKISNLVKVDNKDVVLWKTLLNKNYMKL